jgi:hypothetical protein
MYTFLIICVKVILPSYVIIVGYSFTHQVDRSPTLPLFSITCPFLLSLLWKIASSQTQNITQELYYMCSPVAIADPWNNGNNQLNRDDDKAREPYRVQRWNTMLTHLIDFEHGDPKCFSTLLCFSLISGYTFPAASVAGTSWATCFSEV